MEQEKKGGEEKPKHNHILNAAKQAAGRLPEPSAEDKDGPEKRPKKE